MKSYLNFLKRNKLYSAINILGLCLSMAFVLLLAIYVYRQLSTDSYQKNADRIYLVTNEENLNMGYYLPRLLKQKFPEIEASASYSNGGICEFTIDGETVNTNMAYADSSFFDMFSFKVLEGTVDSWKASMDRAFISRSFALSHFDGDPTGKTMTFSDREITIAGVIENISNSVIRDADIFVRGEYMTVTNRANDEYMSNAGSSSCFVMTYPSADLQSRKDDMLSYFKEIFWPYFGDSSSVWSKVRIIPLRDIYFLKDGAEDHQGCFNLGNRSLVNILLTMCLLLLLFAILNYVNMTTALMGFRAKEMALRRLNGASRGSIFAKTIAESTLMCAVAMILAAILGELLSPAASELLNYDISLSANISFPSVAFCIVLTLFIGVLAGIVPATLIQQVQPIEIVRGTLKMKTKTLYSKVIIILQNAITAVMLVIVLAMYLQVHSMINAPLGYETGDQILLDNNFGRTGQLSPLIDRLNSESCIDAVGLGNGHPLGGTNNWTVRLPEGNWISFQQIQGDSTYFNILGIRKKQDNNAPGNWWLNEYAFKSLGIDETETSFNTYSSGELIIGGIYHDFKIYGILDNQSAALIYQHDRMSDNSWPWNILIKTNGDHATAYAKVCEIINELYPDKFIEAEYVEDKIRNSFASERQMLKIMLIFTIISMLVSALGLVAMSSYYLQQQRRAVSLKKVFGAGYNGVLAEIVMSFMKLVGIAFIISVPVSWFIMHSYLRTFSYHIPLSWWIFAISGLFTGIIAVLSVFWQSVRTASTDPAVELKKD